MRISHYKSGTAYSPDDGDWQGFFDLLKQWVEEDRVGLYREADLLEFAQNWNATVVSLRKKSQWLNELKKFVAGRR